MKIKYHKSVIVLSVLFFVPITLLLWFDNFFSAHNGSTALMFFAEFIGSVGLLVLLANSQRIPRLLKVIFVTFLIILAPVFLFAIYFALNFNPRIG